MDAISEAADPATPLARLAELAHQHPETRVAVAGNPSTYPGLLTWLDSLEDPEIDAALRGRADRAGTVAPAVPGPPPSTHAAAPAAARAPAAAPALAADPDETGERFQFFPAGIRELRSLFGGRRLAVFAIVVASVLVAEAAALGIASIIQQPTRSAHGYDFGPNVGAEVLRVPAPDADELGPFSISSSGELQASTDEEVLTFDPESLSVIRRDPLLPPPPGYDDSDPTLLAYSPDETLAYTIADDIYDTRLLVLDRSSGQIMDSIPVGGFFIGSIVVAAQSGTIFVSTLEQGGETPGHLIALDPVSHQELARTEIGTLEWIAAVNPDGTFVCLIDRDVVSFTDGTFSAPVALSGSHDCTSFTPDGGAVLRYGTQKFSVSDAATGETLFKIPTDVYLEQPVALPDPSLGFAVVGDYYDEPRYLYRFTSDAPRLSAPALVAILVAIDLVLALLGLVVVFLVPLIRHRRVTAPQRLAAAEARQIEQQQRADDERRQADAHAARTAHEQRVGELAKWEAAYAELHPGEPIPPMPAHYVTPGAAGAASSERTNTLAILALVFGLGGGLLGIIFGHAARSQIRRTGERGWGLATAGLVFGYLGVCVYLALIIGFGVLANVT